MNYMYKNEAEKANVTVGYIVLMLAFNPLGIE
jgi:hypothetical protein